MDRLDVTVIIVSWNTRDILRAIHAVLNRQNRGIGTKHRDQVMFAINRGDYDWIGASAPRCAASNF